MDWKKRLMALYGLPLYTKTIADQHYNLELLGRPTLRTVCSVETVNDSQKSYKIYTQY